MKTQSINHRSLQRKSLTQLPKLQADRSASQMIHKFKNWRYFNFSYKETHHSHQEYLPHFLLIPFFSFERFVLRVIQETGTLHLDHILLQRLGEMLDLKIQMLTEGKGAIILNGTEIETALDNNNESGITVIKLKNIPVSLRELSLLQKGRWDALVELNLFSQKLNPATAFGPKGCKLLSRTSMPLIAWLNLNCHAITAIGASHLAKAKWPTLRHVDLIMNKLSVGSGSALTKANWKGLSCINLEYNQLTTEDMKALVLVEGTKLRINAQHNKIEDDDGKLEDAFDQRLFALIIYRSFF